MLLLLVLLCLLPLGDAQAQKQPPLITHNWCILPKYDPYAANTMVNADYDVELLLKSGAVKMTSVDPIGSSLQSGQFAEDFGRQIIGAILRWQFGSESGVRYIRISFRVFDTNSEEGKPTYYVYRVDGKVNRLDVTGVDGLDFYVPTIPKEITVEYHYSKPFK